jgi:polygalacturonase
LLPAEPSLPTTLCATLTANLQQTSGLLPSSVDALASNSQPDASRIQSAIDACTTAGGGAVKLVVSGSNNAFLAGPIALKSNVKLWVDTGVTLFASRSPVDYDVGGTSSDAGYCGDASASHKNGCNPWITAISTTNAGIVGEGVVDGRGGAVLTSGSHPNKVTWWDLSIQSKSSTALQQNNFRLLQVTGGSGFTLYKITLTNSPKFHVGTSGTDGFTGWGVKLITPSLAYTKASYACSSGTYPVANQAIETISTCFTPESSKNTDGFDPGNSTNVTVAYSFVSTGDDNIVPKAGSSSSGVLSSNHLYAHNRFYYGHGMSVGSETFDGLNGMKVWDHVTDGMDSGSGIGLRIKSYAGNAGEVQNVLYQNVCMRRVKEPLVFDPFYSTATSTTTKLPNFHDITIQDFHMVNYSGATYNKGTLSFSGYSSTYPLKIALNNVVFDTTPSIDSTNYHDIQFSLGANTSLSPSTSSTVSNTTVSGSATTLSCPSSVFVSFPSSLSPI